MKTILALNAIANKPWAILVLLIGFAMLVSCKKWGIDTTIAGGVIGVASNMLTSKPEPAEPPPGSQIASTTTTEVTPVPKS